MTPFVSIWTPKDTSERGPTVDEESAEVSTDFVELTTVLHVATDGPHGLWTVAVTLDAENAVSLIEKIAERYGLTVAPQVILEPGTYRGGFSEDGDPESFTVPEPAQTWGEATGVDEGPVFYQTPEDPS